MLVNLKKSWDLFLTLNNSNNDNNNNNNIMNERTQYRQRDKGV